MKIHFANVKRNVTFNKIYQDKTNETNDESLSRLDIGSRLELNIKLSVYSTIF